MNTSTLVVASGSKQSKQMKTYTERLWYTWTVLLDKEYSS